VGNGPVTLDFSKAQPIAPIASPSTSSAVTLDFSKAEPINPDRQYALDRTLMNMTRAMSGQKMDNPQDQAIAEKAKEEGFKSAALTAGLGFGAGALAAPAAGAATVGTGILDAGGSEVMKDIATQGPSLARAGMNLVINAIKAHPIISTYVATHLANELGIPLPKILKAVAGIREVAP